MEYVIKKNFFSNRRFDGIEMSLTIDGNPGPSLAWAGYYTHLLEVVVEKDWNYEKVKKFLIYEWHADSHQSIINLVDFATPEIVEQMMAGIEEFITGMINQFQNNRK